MKDFISRGTGNSRFLKSSIDQDTTFEQLVAMLRSGTFPIDLNGVNADGVNQRGTPINKLTLLTDDTADALGLPSDDNARTVNKALMALLNVGAKNLHYVEYLKSANWVAPENITGNAIVICVGGGGGGECRTGSGGGSGYIEIESVELSPGETYRIVIGAGGAGGEPAVSAVGTSGTPATPGGDGGTTTFGSIVSANGGKGGNWSGIISKGGDGEAGGGAGGTATAETGRNGGNGRKYGGGGGAGFGGGKGGNGGTYGAGGGVAYQSVSTKYPGSTPGSSGSMAGQPFSDNVLMYGPHASELSVSGTAGFGGKNGTVDGGNAGFGTSGYGGGGYGGNGGNTAYRYRGGAGGGGFGGKGGNGSERGGGGGGGFFGAGGDGQVDKNGGNGARGGGGGGTMKDTGTGTYTGGNGGSGVCAIIYSTRGE